MCISLIISCDQINKDMAILVHACVYVHVHHYTKITVVSVCVCVCVCVTGGQRKP